MYYWIKFFIFIIKYIIDENFYTNCILQRPQLIPTIKDMLANAKKPKNLVFSIARQFSETDGFDNLDEYRKAMQIDSHMRFEKN
jgi:hypothetical protein